MWDGTEHTNWDRPPPACASCHSLWLETLTLGNYSAGEQQPLKLMCNHRLEPDIKTNLTIFGSHKHHCKYDRWDHCVPAASRNQSLVRHSVIALHRTKEKETEQEEQTTFTAHMKAQAGKATYFFFCVTHFLLSCSSTKEAVYARKWLSIFDSCLAVYESCSIDYTVHISRALNYS